MKKEVCFISNLNKVKPGMMRKHIPVENVEKYLSGQYNGIWGFIARQDYASLKSLYFFKFTSSFFKIEWKDSIHELS